MSCFAVDWDIKESKHEVPTVQLWYPRNDGCAKHLEIELSDVRAADSLRVSYDFERDGWVIEQAAIFEFACDDPIADPEWAEVAFVKAWARLKETPP